MSNRFRKNRYLIITLFIGGLVTALLLIELLLNLTEDNKYYVWLPHTQTIFYPNSEVIPGVKGRSVFKVNNEGMRGDEYWLDYDYKILTVGGSSTECLYLDQHEAWPQMIQDILNRKTGMNIFVGNVGKSGHNTREHYYQVKYLLKQYNDINMLIILAGVNDLIINITDPYYKYFDFNDPAERNRVIDRAFAVKPYNYQNQKLHLFQKLLIWQFLDSTYQHLFIYKGGIRQDLKRIEDDKGLWHQTEREYRRKAKYIINTMPNMELGLREYANNLNKIIDIARSYGVDILLLTQPAMWDKSLSEVDRNLLWLGVITDSMHAKTDKYYSVEVLAKAMNKYNQVLLDICRKRGIECIDLAAMFSKDTHTFYDDVHFNEEGSRKVANMVSDYLLKNNTFIKAEFTLEVQQ